MESISNELREALIQDFEKEKERMLLNIEKGGFKTPFVKAAFFSHQMIPVIAVYNMMEKRFTCLELDLIVGDKVEYRKINLNAQTAAL